MSEKNENRKKHIKKSKNIVKDYVLTNIVFLIILLAVTIGVIFGALKPVTALVHKVESVANMQNGDISVKENSEIVPYSKESSEYGDCVANITCESRGLNTSVYVGLNRVSARYGVALARKGCFFTENGTAIVAGYDETYFGPLKYLEKGDVITVTTADREVTYKVDDAFYESSEMRLEGINNDLVLYSSFSDFSENTGKCYYVFADKIDREGN
ncbi:MAG: sortase domain-bontaining protein [Eubacterium sp.]